MLFIVLLHTGPGYFGVEPNNTMDKMIYAFDELSVLYMLRHLFVLHDMKDWK
jgi:hypothetical protein